MRVKNVGKAIAPVLLSLFAGVLFAGSAQPAEDVKIQDGVQLVRDASKINGIIKKLGKGGGQIYLPAGVYMVDEPIVLADNITLTGDGPATVLKATPQFDEYLKNSNIYASNSDVAVFFNPQKRYAGIIICTGVRGARISNLAVLATGKT